MKNLLVCMAALLFATTVSVSAKGEVLSAALGFDGIGSGVVMIGPPDTVTVIKNFASPDAIAFLSIETNTLGQVILEENIINETGVDWLDFHWELDAESAKVAEFVGIASTSPFDTQLVEPDSIFVDTGVLKLGDNFTPTVTLSFLSAGEITITQYPSFVPEPSGLVLVMLSMAGFAFFNWRRSKV